MKQRGDYLIIGLTLIGLAALLLAYSLEPLPLHPGPAAPAAAGDSRHWLAAILFVALILLLVESIVEERSVLKGPSAQDDRWPYDRRLSEPRRWRH